MDNRTQKSIDKSIAKANKKNSFGGRVRANILAQVAAVVVCIIFSLSLAGLFENTFGLIVVLLITNLMYFSALYVCMWDIGNHDCNRVRFGHEERNDKKGFMIGAVANIPTWVMVFVLILGKMGIFNDNQTLSQGIIVVYKLLNPQVWPLLNLMSNTVIFNDISWIHITVISLAVSLVTVASGFFYIMGLNDFAPFQKLVYKNTAKKKGK